MTKDQMEVLFTSWRNQAHPPQSKTTHSLPLSDQGQHNTATKNANTQNRYTELTHIFQNLTYALQEENVAIAHEIPSHLIACVIWHIPDQHLREETYFDAVKDSILYLHHKTQRDDRCNTWIDINTNSLLFHTGAPYSRESLHAYLTTAWTSLGFSASFLG